MKKIYLILLMIFSILAGCKEDAEKWSDTMDNADVGGAIPNISFQTPRIFDFADLQNTRMIFDLKVGAAGEGLNYTKVIVNKSFNGGDFILHAEYLAGEIPAEIALTAADALSNFEGVTISTVQGGDFIDWQFLMEFPDGTNGEYNVDALASFPDFRSYFASAPSGFTVEGSYTMNMINDDIGVADATKSGYQIQLVPGSGKSQYILEDITGTSLANLWDLPVPYRIYYIGNNEFVLNPGSEEYPDLLRMIGTVVRDAGSGVITVNVTFANSCCGLNGANFEFELVPD
ncbi:MAG: hypothetical protein JXJ22_08705 [Bacteroidales bacterium]|nr:hypothetical protein [Bacteroidales bacterium]